jgi:GTP-binding protein EngB required for normal cell division
MNTQAGYSQRAAAWLKLLAPWWRAFGRGEAIRKVEDVLNNAEGDIQAARNVFEAEYSRHQETRARLDDTCVQLEAERSRHKDTMAKLNATRGKLEAERTDHGATQDELKQLSSRQDLITTVLGAANSEHPKYLAFRKLFREDFLRFANAENLYEREAEAILRLQAVEEELRLLGRVPLFRDKTIIAVAGGFSSGKSSLISSFFDHSLKVTLPIAMEPVTAIPTYIAHSAKTAVIGFPAHGGTVEIFPELFAQMRHDFLKALGFDLRRILPFIMLETPWRKPWESLCFIDTPGYNPAKGGGATAADDTTTADALRQADALLWVLGIDANGEISSEDLDYLVNHGSNIPLAIVVNKADSRPRSQVREIVEQIRDTLDAHFIQYCCISAYSSVEGREYDYVGQSLDNVLGGWNKPTLRGQRLCSEVTSVLDAYIESFNSEINSFNANEKELNSLKLDLDELGLFDETSSSIINRRHDEIKGKSSDRLKNLWNLPQVGKVAAHKNEAEIKNRRQDEIKEKARDRLKRIAELFNVEKIVAHKHEAERIRKLMTHLFAEDW